MPRTTKVKQEQVTPAPAGRWAWRSSNTPLLVLIAVLLALILLGGAFAAGRHSGTRASRPTLMRQRLAPGQPEFGRHHLGSFLNSSNRVIGVVTKVDGSHFTVASNGSTKDVQTNSSTQYHGGDSVKPNDTVAVFGSTANGQFTASQVMINP